MHYKNPTLYVSSNTKDVSSDADALAELHSPAFASLVKDTPGAHTGIGKWADGSEPVRIVTVAPHEALKVGAALGLKYKQKQVLVYLPHRDGKDARFVWHGLANRHSPAQIRDLLRANGLSEYHTIGEDGDVHVVHESSQGLPPAAVPLSGQLPSVSSGHATFLGGTTRDEGAAKFNEVLNGSAAAG